MEERPLDGVEQVVCFTECTGLIPALPQDEEVDRSKKIRYNKKNPR